jgi:hypothetical protein
LKCGALVPKHPDGSTAAARDVFENVVYCLDAGHDGHFHATVSAARKLNAGLEFLKGTRWKSHGRHVTEYMPNVARFGFADYRRHRVEQIRVCARPS